MKGLKMRHGRRPSLRGCLANFWARDGFAPGVIMTMALLVFAATSSRTAEPTLHWLFNTGGGADRIAAAALFLNVALIVFAWVRHKDAQRAVLEGVAAQYRAHVLQTRDTGTNLLNRRTLRDRAVALIGAARIDRGNVALMVVALNKFKNVNDAHGELVGDALLQTVASIICSTVPRDALCARLGSDEFAVVLPFQSEDQEKVSAVAKEIHARLSQPILVLGVSAHISASIGLSNLGYDCVEFSTLLRRANLALAHAKAHKAALPTWFNDGMESVFRARSEIEVGLKQGIPLGEFVPYFQPLVSFTTGRIEGFEILARWHHPAGGVVGPDVFVPVAEDAGLIDDLLESLMKAAFREAKEWKSAQSLSVNISPKQLVDPWFPQRILKLLTEAGFPASRLEIEITESALIENLEIAGTAIESFRSQGIRVILDDFGTGYSSLSRLRQLSIDRIKIDKSFILDSIDDSEGWTIVKTVAELGKTLGVAVTIEGVENAAIETRVRELGCATGQGWFFGQAAPAAQTRELLMLRGELSALVAGHSPSRNSRQAA